MGDLSGVFDGAKFAEAVRLTSCVVTAIEAEHAAEKNETSALYSHKLHTGWLHNVSNPEEFGFASRLTLKNHSSDLSFRDLRRATSTWASKLTIIKGVR